MRDLKYEIQNMRKICEKPSLKQKRNFVKKNHKRGRGSDGFHKTLIFSQNQEIRALLSRKKTKIYKPGMGGGGGPPFFNFFPHKIPIFFVGWLPLVTACWQCEDKNRRCSQQASILLWLFFQSERSPREIKYAISDHLVTMLGLE